MCILYAHISSVPIYVGPSVTHTQTHAQVHSSSSYLVWYSDAMGGQAKLYSPMHVPVLHPKADDIQYMATF